VIEWSDWEAVVIAGRMPNYAYAANDQAGIDHVLRRYTSVY
jgi:hypothetical protein